MEFWKKFEQTFDMALANGWRSQPLRFDREKNHPRKHREFLAACHRGYEKAQNRVVEMLYELENDTELSNAEKLWRERLLRRLMDSVAFLIFKAETHLMRRLILHDESPKLSFPVLKDTLKAANKLNEESRMTFALLSDLTTFVHVGDIVRADARQGKARFSLIELKSGRVNAILAEKLQKYPPTEDGLKTFQSEEKLDEKKQDQATRMFRQRIRLENVEQLVRNDTGVDNKTKKGVIWSRETYHTVEYDSFLDELLDEARKSSLSAGVQNHCLHFGVGYSEDPAEARCLAFKALNAGYVETQDKLPNGCAEIVSEVNELVPRAELFRAVDMVYSNLFTLATRPFLLWNIHKQHALGIAKRRLCVVGAFDLPLFIWLCRTNGIRTYLSTRKEAAEYAKGYGAAECVTWGGRMLWVETANAKWLLGGGVMSRFFNDLESPLPFIKASVSATFPEPPASSAVMQPK
jgi:hypothetical protein